MVNKNKNIASKKSNQLLKKNNKEYKEKACLKTIRTKVKIKALIKLD